MKATESAEIVKAVGALTKTVSGKVKEIDDKVDKAETEFREFGDALGDMIGFTALNYNNDFLDTREVTENTSGFKNRYPVGMGVGANRNDAFKVEMIGVRSTVEPSSRHPEAQELLDFMGVGSGSRNFSRTFNILKMTILSEEFQSLSGYDFYIPDQHVKQSPVTTFLAYTKIKGSGTVRWLGEDTKGQWKQINIVKNHTNPGTYTHVDLLFSDFKKGDEIYLALPTVCVGRFPKNKKHGKLYNPKNDILRKVEKMI